jgi:hypothetical protein
MAEPVWLQVGDHDVECSADFRLFLHTSTAPHNVPPELAAHVTIVFFHATRLDIEDELLDRFMLHEKARINDERQALLQVRTATRSDLRGWDSYIYQNIV